MEDVKPFAFVLMPFRPEFDDIYRLGIKKCAEDLGIVAERVDDQHFSETILERIYRQIDGADFVIAEMTGQNPNVFYEVGYAHAKGKPCALITQDSSDIPFDLLHHTHVIYDGRVVDLIEKLKPKMEWLACEVEEARKRTLVVHHHANSGFLEKADHRHKGNFDLDITIRNQAANWSAEIEAIYIITNRNWFLRSNDADLRYDDYVSDDGKKRRKHLLSPSLRRLRPNTFLKERLTFRRNFWTIWSGEEKQESYTSKGKVGLEIATENGLMLDDLYLEVQFDEFPF